MPTWALPWEGLATRGRSESASWGHGPARRIRVRRISPRPLRPEVDMLYLRVSPPKEIAMAHPDIIRAWKDPEYRLGLSAAEQARLPDSPAGAVELTDDELNAAAGGTSVVTDDCYVTGEFTCAGQP